MSTRRLSDRPENAGPQAFPVPRHAAKDLIVLALLALLVLALPFFALQIKSAPPFVPVSAALCFVVAFLISFLASPKRWLTLGVLLPLAPIVGPGSVNLLAVAFVMGTLLASRRRSVHCGALTGQSSLVLSLIGIAVAWGAAAVHTAIADFDFAILATVFQAGGVIGLYRFLILNPPLWMQGISEFLGLLVALLLLGLFVREGSANTKRELLLGLSCGVMAGGVFGLCQLLGLHPLFDINRGPFWVLEGRYSGSFSDPNALGIMAILVAPVLFPGSLFRRSEGGILPRWELLTRCAASLLLVLLAPFSGSRTFFLGLLLLAVHLFFRLLPGGRGRVRVAGVAAALCVAAVFVSGYPPVNDLLHEKLALPGVERVLDTLHWERASAAFSSRVIFGRIAVAVSAEHPLIGVGLSSFRAVVPRFAERVGIAIGSWTDNANNLYLHLLAEQGALGVVLIVVSVVFLWCSIKNAELGDQLVGWEERGAASAARTVLGLSLILFVTGPHILFEEVRLWVFFLVGLALIRAGVSEGGVVGSEVGAGGLLFCKSGSAILVGALSALLILGVIVGARRPLHRGWYGFERGLSGESIRWMGKDASLRLCGELSELVIRTIQPGLGSDNPVTVRISVRSGGATTALSPVVLSVPEWQQVAIPPGVVKAGDELLFEVSRVWSPAGGGVGDGDTRYLGAMLRWPVGGLCE